MTDLILVGASVRAAAASARRAGLRPWCADLFADSDLLAITPDVVRCPADQYPAALEAILRDAPAAPWAYTGALENYPRLVRQMSIIRPLWGNNPAALRACRDPFTVARLLCEADLPAPEVRAAGAGLDSRRRWLRKPRAGAAGQGVGFTDSATAEGRRSGRDYWQQYIPGPSLSAVLTRVGSDAQLLGVTEQIIGAAWLNAPAFRYAGNIGPVRLPHPIGDQVLQAGRAIGAGCELRGLFGLDFILHADRPWVVEVNPRYPASAEVLELATGIRVLAHHRHAFDPTLTMEKAATGTGGVVGKAILYSPRRFAMPQLDGIGELGTATGGPARLADVPAAGEVIEAGWPVLTLLVAAADRDACVRRLMTGAAALRQSLFDSAGLSAGGGVPSGSG